MRKKGGRGTGGTLANQSVRMNASTWGGNAAKGMNSLLDARMRNVYSLVFAGYTLPSIRLSVRPSGWPWRWIIATNIHLYPTYLVSVQSAIQKAAATYVTRRYFRICSYRRLYSKPLAWVCLDICKNQPVLMDLWPVLFAASFFWLAFSVFAYWCVCGWLSYYCMVGYRYDREGEIGRYLGSLGTWVSMICVGMRI